MGKIVICLVGPIAAGKGTVDEILQKDGFAPYTFSDGIKEEIKKRGMEINRFSLNQVSNEMRQNQGSDYWARVCAEAIDREGHEKVVVDGARNPHEIEFLKDKYGAKVIGITADQNLRYRRLLARRRINENLTLEQFKELDDRENTQTDDNAQKINESMKLADLVINNDGSVEELKFKVEKFLSSL